jgi:hypothetical protein
MPVKRKKHAGPFKQMRVQDVFTSADRPMEAFASASLTARPGQSRAGIAQIKNSAAKYP